MKKFIAFVFAVVAISVSAFAQMGNLSYSSVKVTSVSMSGFTSVRGGVAIEVSNDGAPITITDIKGVLFRNGTTIFNGSAENVYIPSGKSTVNVKGLASLASFSAILTVLNMKTGFNFNGYTADASFMISVDGQEPVDVQKKGINVSSYLNK